MNLEYDNHSFATNPRFLVIGVVVLAVVLFVHHQSNPKMQTTPNPAEMVIQPVYTVNDQPAGTPEALVKQINDFNNNLFPQWPSINPPTVVGTNISVVRWPG